MDHRIDQMSQVVRDGRGRRADLRGRLTGMLVIVASIALGLIVLAALLLAFVVTAEVVLQILVHVRVLT